MADPRDLAHAEAGKDAQGPEVCRRTEALGPEGGRFSKGRLTGTPDQLLDAMARFAEAGTTRLRLRPLDLTDPDRLECLASEVLPQLR